MWWRYKRIFGYYWIVRPCRRVSDVHLEQRWVGGSTRCLFFSVSDIYISVWHHKRFRIAVWYLTDDCLAISAIADKRHLRSARTGLLPVPRTTTTLGMRSFVVAGPVIWNSWNVATPLVNPKGRTLKRNIPFLMTKAVLSASFGARAHWWYPLRRIIRENRQLTAKASKHWSVFGSGYASFLVTA